MHVNINVATFAYTLWVLEVLRYLVPGINCSAGLDELFNSVVKVHTVLNSDSASNGIPLIPSSFVHTLTKNLKLCRSRAMSVLKAPFGLQELELVPHFAK